MRKLLILISSIAVLSITGVFTAAADQPTISDAPVVVSTGSKPEETAAAVESTANNVVGAAPVSSAETAASESAPTADTSQTAIQDSSTASGAPAVIAAPTTETTAAAQTTGPVQTTTVETSTTGPMISVSSTAALISDVPTTAEYQEVGKTYSTTAEASVDLGFTVVSPNHDFNGFKVAEGMVHLGNGNWESLDYKQYIRGGYYRLLREETDSNGTGWYVVAANATQIGNYRTSDGSRITELYLKKSDCVASNTISLNTTNSVRQAIVRAALQNAGKQYVYSGNGPDVFDCSGFVKYVMSQAGITVPRTSGELCSAGTQVGISGLRPGDICGRSGHVGIYIGNGYFIHASESATGVVVESVAVYNKYRPFTSYVNVVGD